MILESQKRSKAASRRRKDAAMRIVCQHCGHTSTQTHCGRLCYGCYVALLGLQRDRERIRDADRERRIRLYTERAARREPLFG